jgi:hypothetical protein
MFFEEALSSLFILSHLSSAADADEPMYASMCYLNTIMALDYFGYSHEKGKSMSSMGAKSSPTDAR